MDKNLLDFFIKFKKSFIYRDFVLDLFSKSVIQEFQIDEKDFEAKLIPNNKKLNMYPGKLFVFKGNTYYLINIDNDDSNYSYEKVNFKITKPLFHPSDKFILKEGMIENYIDKKPIETTIGKFFSNQIILVDVFGDTIPYVNEKWNVRRVEKDIVNACLNDEITVQQIKEYINNIYYLSGFVELFTPGFSKKALTVSKEIIKRRNELFKIHKNELDDPNVMLAIEKELIELDKKYLKDDVSNKFLSVKSRKAFDVSRKKMYLMHGMTETFGDNTKEFNFLKSNLDNGWTKEDMPLLFNDVRKGIYDRAVNTAKGGAETKFLGRMFQESEIVMDDCKSKKGITVHLTEMNISRFFYRNIIVGDKLVLLTENNASSFLNKTVMIRSFLYCLAKGGYCYACADARFKQIGLKVLNLLPIKITSGFLMQSMKSMHGKTVDSYTIDSFDKFLI